MKRKRGRQPGSHNKNSMLQDSQDSTKMNIKDGPCRQCSLCAKEKQEALVACRDCTVRGKVLEQKLICLNFYFDINTYVLCYTCSTSELHLQSRGDASKGQ